MTTTAGIDLGALDVDSAAGHEVAEKRAEESRVDFDRVKALRLKAEETVFVRFLNDFDKHSGPLSSWITVRVHKYHATKEKPEDRKGNWPSNMDAVCRNDKIFKNLKFGSWSGKPEHSACYLCDMGEGRATDVTWALVALLEPVEDEKGKLIGLKTAMKDVQRGEKGKTEVVTVQDIRLLTMGWSNFFSDIAALADMNETVLNYDLKIRRKGSGRNDTEYKFSPVAPRTVKVDGENVLLDLRDKALMDRFFPEVPNLLGLIVERATEQYYDRWFIPGRDGFESDEEESEGRVSTKPATPAPNNDRDPERMDALRRRALGESYDSDEESASEEPASTLRSL